MKNIKEDKRVIKTKRLIRETFLNLLSNKEFEKISVSEIARVAEIDRKTFYLHYGNTSELLSEFEQNLLEEAKEKLSKNEDFDIPLLFNSFNDIFKANSNLFEVIIKRRVNTFFLKKCENIIIELLKHKLLKGREIGSRMEYHIRYIAAGLIAVYIEWINDENNLHIDDISSLAMDIVDSNFRKIDEMLKIESK